MSKMGHHTKEPDKFAAMEKVLRFSSLMYRAYIEDVVYFGNPISLTGQGFFLGCRVDLIGF